MFLLWAAAGLADFALHRRTDLSHTSGLAESRLHLVQLGLMGIAALVWWALAPTWGAWWIAAALVIAHAGFGYLDTRSAWGKRAITPVEQHVHSVLDAMPWIFLGAYAWTVDDGFALALRPRDRSLAGWIGVPALIVGAFAVAEWRAAGRARAERGAA
ncbi:hypothetical protein P6166_02245 [Stenotrophomonas sp. HITSZ_GD]|uniref:hypothetical protein n=1 Tax=Stenotrophomonas sp. HITSZ_GD TaxID=3037248 RepID=UPI00240E0A93|nr:hypothetical protein [Stenotrophomonas sp. HITSZ_GD]MDG2524178.1 hypothetical protein [Stenotrophomonas sp. HITSZ_GD]